MGKLKRIWHNYTLWEDYKNGFYSKGKITDEVRARSEISEFFQNENLFLHTACEVIHNWRYSVEYNLSNIYSNRQAYLGQVSVNYLYGYPAYFTSKVFSEMDKTLKIKANATADTAISFFEEKYYNPLHPKIVRGKNEKLS